MCPNGTYFGLKVVPIYGYFGAKVSTIWVHGPLGLVGRKVFFYISGFRDNMFKHLGGLGIRGLIRFAGN